MKSFNENPKCEIKASPFVAARYGATPTGKVILYLIYFIYCTQFPPSSAYWKISPGWYSTPQKKMLLICADVLMMVVRRFYKPHIDSNSNTITACVMDDWYLWASNYTFIFCLQCVCLPKRIQGGAGWLGGRVNKTNGNSLIYGTAIFPACHTVGGKHVFRNGIDFCATKMD